jgi:hypothetical protein
MKPKGSLIGMLILDDDKIGVITNEIKSGTWSEEPMFNWTTSYEIKYTDGTLCIMTEVSLFRLIEKGRIKILSGDEK